MIVEIIVVVGLPVVEQIPCQQFGAINNRPKLLARRREKREEIRDEYYDKEL
jgi:hypothetical protein